MNKPTRVWSLQEAKAKFSEVVRRAQIEGPRTVTCRGEPVAAIAAVETPPKKKHKQAGADLIAVLQACPYPKIFDEIDRIRKEERKFVDHVNELLAKDDEEKRSRAQRASEVCP